MLRELGVKYPKMFLSTTNWFRAMDHREYFDNPGDHAEEMETSLMLYLKPELILSREDWGKGKEKRLKISAFSESWAWTERKWSSVTEDTGIGDPAKATKEKGERFFKAVTDKMAGLFVDLCQADLDDLYE
jgi:creatinine amidohydrolase